MACPAGAIAGSGVLLHAAAPEVVVQLCFVQEV